MFFLLKYICRFTCIKTLLQLLCDDIQNCIFSYEIYKDLSCKLVAFKRICNFVIDYCICTAFVKEYVSHFILFTYIQKYCIFK